MLMHHIRTAVGGLAGLMHQCSVKWVVSRASVITGLYVLGGTV